MIDRIQWLGHGSFIIQGPPLIYINPWRVVRSVFHADVILVSHDHYEHCSLADIEKLRGEETLIIGNEKVARQIEGCKVLRPWQSITVEPASIKAVPAYSTKKLLHPIEDAGLGFVISLNFFDIYYAGDTEDIPEMERIKPDIAILPIDGNGTLNVADAVEVVKKMRPRWVIPSNWGSVGDSATHLDAQAFKEAVGGRAEVIIPQLTR
ncbi:MAG: MBL fold metallo-hydrolase [Chitinophagaceae bacterium]|nr:MBL fold metallo-hydrolase [Anaerolineae bacterium]